MKPHDALPTEELPLRETLPGMRAETINRLIAWILVQPRPARDWVFRRSSDYFRNDSGATAPEIMRLEAVAALDLLAASGPPLLSLRVAHECWWQPTLSPLDMLAVDRPGVWMTDLLGMQAVLQQAVDGSG